MNLDEIMESKFGMVSANDYAAEALRLMYSKNLDWVFVLDRNQIAGVVFARDLERLSESTLIDRDVREYVNTNLLVVGADTEPQEAARLLRLSGRNFLAVVQDNRPLGILTAESLARPGRGLRQLQAS